MPSMPTSGHRAAHAVVARRRRSVRLYHGGCRNATPPTRLRQGPLSVVPGRMAQPGDEWVRRLWFCYEGAAAGVLCIVAPDYRQIQKTWQDRRKPWFPPRLEHAAPSDAGGLSAADGDWRLDGGKLTTELAACWMVYGGRGRRQAEPCQSLHFPSQESCYAQRDAVVFGRRPGRRVGLCRAGARGTERAARTPRRSAHGGSARREQGRKGNARRDSGRSSRASERNAPQSGH